MADVEELKRLLSLHDDELLTLATLDAYYREGNDNALRLPEQARNDYRDILDQARTPWLGLVVDVTAERLIVDGFRSPTSEELGAELWGWWQANRLDGRQMALNVATLRDGYSFVGVWPGAEEGDAPVLRPEPGASVFVEYADPVDPWKATAGVKIRGDVAWLYGPDRVVRFRKNANAAEEWSVVEEIENPLEAVPYVKFRARPDLCGGTRSEIVDAIPVQDRINRTVVDRLLAQTFSAFRQRWATGLGIETDDTGKAIEPFRTAVDRLWISEDEHTKFGEFDEATLSNYLGAAEADVQHLAAITRTPPHYLLGHIANISADAIIAAESGLSRKVAERQQTFGESWEEVLRLAAKATGRDELVDDALETIWRRTETISEAQVVDAATKLATIGVPSEALWERIGATPQEVTRWHRLAQRDAIRAALRAPLSNAGNAAPEPAEDGGEP